MVFKAHVYLTALSREVMQDYQAAYEIYEGSEFWCLLYLYLIFFQRNVTQLEVFNVFLNAMKLLFGFHSGNKIAIGSLRNICHCLIPENMAINLKWWELHVSKIRFLPVLNSPLQQNKIIILFNRFWIVTSCTLMYYVRRFPINFRLIRFVDNNGAVMMDCCR